MMTDFTEKKSYQLLGLLQMKTRLKLFEFLQVSQRVHVREVLYRGTLEVSSVYRSGAP